MVRLWLLALRLALWTPVCLVRRGEAYEFVSPSGRVTVRTCTCGASSILARDYYAVSFRRRSFLPLAERVEKFLRHQGCEIEAAELERLVEAMEAEA